ncbi:MAG: YdcF family protein [Clostridiales bacterium]|nr:YdcF family protein [Clostridiales bacterium]
MEGKEIILVIPGLVCLVYGWLVYRLRSGTATFGLWLFLGFAFLGAAAGMHFHILAGLPGFWSQIGSAVFVLLLLVFVIVEIFIVSGFFAGCPENLDYLIVLGAQVYGDGPSNVLKYRLDAACGYLLENRGTLCIVSGGQGPNEPCPEARVMCRYLMKNGVEEARIFMEEESTTTMENLANSSRYFDKERDTVGIVTNNFHLFRGMQLARKMGVKKVYGIPAGVRPLYLPNNMLRELFGVLKDLFYGNLL